jgi:hypothetical protein
LGFSLYSLKTYSYTLKFYQCFAINDLKVTFSGRSCRKITSRSLYLTGFWVGVIPSFVGFLLWFVTSGDNVAESEALRSAGGDPEKIIIEIG